MIIIHPHWFSGKILDVAPFLFRLKLSSSKDLLVASLIHILLRISGASRAINLKDPFLHSSLVLNGVIQNLDKGLQPFIEMPIHLDEFLIMSNELSLSGPKSLFDCTRYRRLYSLLVFMSARSNNPSRVFLEKARVHIPFYLRISTNCIMEGSKR